MSQCARINGIPYLETSIKESMITKRIMDHEHLQTKFLSPSQGTLNKHCTTSLWDFSIQD
jgi:hypothetical protein